MKMIEKRNENKIKDKLKEIIYKSVEKKDLKVDYNSKMM
jgi:hypothetical protein